MTVEISLSRILVFAPDLGVARQFYSEVLGLQLEREAERLLTFRGSNFDLNVFACASSSDFDGYSQQAGAAVAFSVRSLEAAISELSARGVRFLHPSPKQGPVGRYVAFVDPFGTVFELVETAGTSTARPNDRP